MKAAYFICGVLVGGVVGSLTTFFFSKRYFDKKNDEDIQSVIDSFTHPKSVEEKPIDISDATNAEEEKTEKPHRNLPDAVEKDSYTRYMNLMKDLGYTDYTKAEIDELSKNLGYRNYEDPNIKTKAIETTTGIPEDTMDTVTWEANPDAKPVIITPEEFGDDETYHRITLVYYADGYLCDEDELPLDDPEDVVGPNIASHFNEYEDDCAYVRNDKYHAYYEVLRSAKTFRREDEDV